MFKATTKEDFKDVVKLLPENTPLPASNKMTYLIARLELHPAVSIQERLALVNEQGAPMADAVGPAVGCLMATFGTNMISSCIFDFDDPEDLEEFAVEERIELWGLQVPLLYPHLVMRTSARVHLCVGHVRLGAASLFGASPGISLLTSKVHATVGGRAARFAGGHPCVAPISATLQLCDTSVTSAVYAWSLSRPVAGSKLCHTVERGCGLIHRSRVHTVQTRHAH